MNRLGSAMAAGLGAGLLAVAGVLAGCGTGSGTGVVQAGHPHATTGSAPARVVTFARRMLARQPLPPGARPPTDRPPADLKAATTAGRGPHSIDLARFYQVPGSQDSVLTFITRHNPLGPGSVGGGNLSSPRSATEGFVYYEIDRTPDGVSQAILVASVLPDRAGGTWLRIDAQVVGAPLRSAAEHVNPADYRAIKVIVDRSLPNSGTVTKVITSRAVIAELAGRLNAMHTAGGGFSSCPLNTSFRNQLVFEPASAKVRELVATILPCGFVQVRVDGRAQPTLVDRGDLRTFIEHLVKGAVNRAGHRPPPPVS